MLQYIFVVYDFMLQSNLCLHRRSGFLIDIPSCLKTTLWPIPRGNRIKTYFSKWLVNVIYWFIWIIYVCLCVCVYLIMFELCTPLYFPSGVLSDPIETTCAHINCSYFTCFILIGQAYLGSCGTNTHEAIKSWNGFFVSGTTTTQLQKMVCHICYPP